MSDRLSTLDASFLYLEDASTPMHVGTVMVFEPPKSGFEFQALLDLVANRIPLVPRYRQRIQHAPARIANPMWVDDAGFDLSYHVRRSALPKPGTDEQLAEFVGRIMSRPLDRERPLWELYLVEGLADGNVAVVTKVHEALLDGVRGIDIGQVIVSAEMATETERPHTWHPKPAPSVLEFMADSAMSVVRRPGQVVEDTVHLFTNLNGLTRRVVANTSEVVSTVARSVMKPAPSSPLNRKLGSSRRYVMVDTDLEAHRKARAGLARVKGSVEHVTVHDVALAAIAGGLRSWLLARGQAVENGTTVRAMVPLSVTDDESGDDKSEVIACYLNLPVGEPNPRMRLHQVAYGMQAQVEARSALSARSLTDLAGFAPPTLHALGARLGSSIARRGFNLMITNVPGPQHQLYAQEAAMVKSYPVIPLAKGQALAIGLTSYNGRVFYGLTADRDAMPDVEMLGQCIEEALSELATGR